MSDTSNTRGANTPGDGGNPAWYKNPVVWGVAGATALLVVILAVTLDSGDDDSDSATETTEQPAATTEPPVGAEPPATTEPPTTEPPATTEPPTQGPEPVVIVESEIRSGLTRADPTDDEMPFEDGDAESHWYQWDGTYVIVYAGWDASQGDPMCPGSSVLTEEFEFISNSPQTAGACDPEGRYPLIIPLDDPMGVRVCGTLVLNHTVIPVMQDDGTPLEGDLYGTVERIHDGGFVSAFGDVPADADAVTELDPLAPAYSVPAGWLPDGATEVTC